MATSGSTYTGYQNYTRFYLTWRLVEQDITNNRSRISWEIGVQGTSGYTAYWYSNAVRINSGYVNGTKVSGSYTYSNITLSGNSRHKLRSGSLWVGHTSSGSKSFSASVSGWLYANGDRSGSDSWSLPTIPRNSQVTTNDSGHWSLGTPIKIYTNRKSTSFTHTITIRMGSSSGTILQTINNVGSSVTWTPTASQITQMQNAIPNDNRLYIHFRQYNNQVKDDSTTAAWTYLRDANPEYSNFTFKDSNTATTAITGNNQILVKGKSTLQVTIPSTDKMTAIKGATASHYAVAYDGSSNQVNYSTSTLTSSFSSIATTGNRTIQVTAFDSRNNSTRVSKNITVYDYAAPVIQTTLERENNFGSDTTVHIEGTYSRLVIGGVAKNNLVSGSLAYRYRIAGGTWGTWTTRAFTANTSNGTFSITDFVLSLNNQNKYEFEFRISDLFGQVTSSNSVDVGTPIMFVGQNSGSAAVGINKMPTQGTLDVEGDIYSNGSKIGETYSTSEIKVGTWINGKPIYRKTVNFGALPNATTKSVAHGAANVEQVVSVSGTFNNGSMAFFLPYTNPDGGGIYNIAIYRNGSNIAIQTGSDRTAYSGYATIEYTKSTD